MFGSMLFAWVAFVYMFGAGCLFGGFYVMWVVVIAMWVVVWCALWFDCFDLFGYCVNSVGILVLWIFC